MCLPRLCQSFKIIPVLLCRCSRICRIMHDDPVYFFPVPFPVLNIHCSLKAPQKNPGGLQYISFPLPRSLPAPVPSQGQTPSPIQNNAHKYSSCQNHHTARKHLLPFSAFFCLLLLASFFLFFRFTSADCFSLFHILPFSQVRNILYNFLFYLFLMAKMFIFIS